MTYLFIACIVLLVFTIILSVKDTIFLKKEEKKDKIRRTKYDRDMEEYYFYMSEEYDRAEEKVTSLCNELNIPLQSDRDEEVL